MCIYLDHVVECCPSQLQDSTLPGSYFWLYKRSFIAEQPSYSPNIFQYYFARKSWLNICFVAIIYLGLIYVSISWGEFPFLEVRLGVVTLEPASKLMLFKIATLDIFKGSFLNLQSFSSPSTFTAEIFLSNLVCESSFSKRKLKGEVVGA